MSFFVKNSKIQQLHTCLVKAIVFFSLEYINGFYQISVKSSQNTSTVWLCTSSRSRFRGTRSIRCVRLGFRLKILVAPQQYIHAFRLFNSFECVIYAAKCSIFQIFELFYHCSINLEFISTEVAFFCQKFKDSDASTSMIMPIPFSSVE
jgi:hypothetical protein